MSSIISTVMSTTETRIPLEQRAAEAAPRFEKAAHLVSRWGLVAILLGFGALKFTAAEAEGIKPMVENSPLMGWLYGIMSVQGVSNFIGVAEIVIALLLGAHRWAPRAAVVGGVGALFMFLTTVSFLVTTPGALGDVLLLGFLAKDVFLFGAALMATSASLRAVGEQRRGLK